MTDTQPPRIRKPTQRQLAYLKDLAVKTGESFAYPQTFAQAVAQIVRLKSTKRTRAADRRRETRQIQRDFSERRGGSAAIRPSEIGGYGSSASWR